MLLQHTFTCSNLHKKKKKSKQIWTKNFGLSSWCKLDDELLMVLSLHLGPQQDASPIQQLIPVAIERRGGCGLARNKNVALSTNSKVYRGKLYIISPIVSHLLWLSDFLSSLCSVEPSGRNSEAEQSTALRSPLLRQQLSPRQSMVIPFFFIFYPSTVWRRWPFPFSSIYTSYTLHRQMPVIPLWSFPPAW